MTIAGSESQTARRSGRAWLALTLVLAAHVADEAVTDFLSVYNPLVAAARQRLGRSQATRIRCIRARQWWR